MKETDKGQWTIYYTLQDDETSAEYDNYYDGPMSLDEAKSIINDCNVDNDKFKKIYGTVYNYSLFPFLEPRTNQLISAILIMLLPLYILYIVFNKVDR